MRYNKDRSQLQNSRARQKHPFEPFYRPTAGSYPVEYVPGSGVRAATQPR